MTFREIIHKLIRNNLRQYALFFFSVLFAVATMGAYGVLQYSPTVTNVLIDGGSTLSIAQGMFLGSMFGIIVFLVYANHLFLKYKSKEIGIFLSLGINRNTVKRIIEKEFNFIYACALLIGLLLAIPLSYLCWSFLNLFLETTETSFIIGWRGLLIIFLFSLIVWLILRFVNQKYIKTIEVMKILKSSEENEKSKTGSLALLIVSLSLIPIGIIGFFFFTDVGGMTYTFLAFIAIISAGIGMYIFIVQLASISDVLKKYNASAYYKNIVFYNLLKQKILGYTRSIFVATLLITFTVFGIGFSVAGFINGYNLAINEPYDYTVHTTHNHTSITENSIMSMAENANIAIMQIKNISAILIGVQKSYSDGYKDWSSQIAVSQSNFNLFTGYNISVSEGSYRLYYDTSMSHRANSFTDEQTLIYNPTTKIETELIKEEFVSGVGLFNTTSFFSSFVILNDNDFESLSANLDEQYKLTSHIMNFENWRSTKDFEDEVLQTIIDNYDGEILINWYNSAVFDKTDRTEEYLTYQGNETRIARVWSLYPTSKLSDTTVKVEAFAVYLMLMLFISIIAFLSSVMVIALKLISTIWGDIRVYTSIQKLGMKQHDIRRLITNQIMFIYFIPTVIGCLAGAFTTYQIALFADIIYISQTMLFVGGVCVVVAILQIIMFFVLRLQIMRRCIM